MANQPQRKPQPKTWAIRDDGMLYPAYDSVLRNARYRPYHGNPNAPLHERLAYLRGENTRNTAKEDAENGVFNIATADKDALIEFMLDEYGFQLDSRKTVERLRNEAVMQIQLRLAEDAAPAQGETNAPIQSEGDEPTPAPRQRNRKAAGIGAEG